MAQPYIGEIRMFASTFAPAGWAFCNGQQMPISENEALYQLIGTQYGGDGQENFNLPDFQCRIPVMSDGGQFSWGNQWVQGQLVGTESVTLTTTQIPVHTHQAFGTVNAATSNSPTNAIPASLPVAAGQLPYGTDPPPTSLSPSSIQPVGGSQPHDNTQPYLVISFIISLFGLFPSPT
jgi:microcystin-dependent protein